MVVTAAGSARVPVDGCLEAVRDGGMEVVVEEERLSRRVGVVRDRKLSALAAEGGGAYVLDAAVDNSARAGNCGRMWSDGRDDMANERNDVQVVLTLDSVATDRKASVHRSAAKEKAEGVPGRLEAFSCHLVKKHMEALPWATG